MVGGVAMSVDFSEVFSALNDGVAFLDADLCILFVNEELERMVGFSARELIGKPFDILCPAELRERYMQAVRGFFESGARPQGRSGVEEAFCRRKDGSCFPAEITLGKIAGAGEWRLLVTVRDITDRKQTEQALREAHKSLEAVFQASPTAIYTIDREFRVGRWNAGAERIFGWRAEEVIGQVIPVVPEDEWESPPEYWRLAFEGTPVNDVEVKRVRKDGSIIDVSVSTAPVRGEDGSVTAVVIVGVDITERKNWERRLKSLNERLESLNQTLESRVEERTALAEARARELARANAELEQFAAVASHDLQEPLRMVISYTQLLSRRYRGRLDEDADAYIGFAVEGALRMQQLIKDLLTYSTTSHGGMKREPVDCNAVFDRAVENLQATIAERRAIVSRGELPVVTGDASHLVRVLQNLIGNGIKFNSSETPRVHVTAEQAESWWVFCVEDNGIGIPEAYRSRIFDVFQKLHTRKEYPGTGIGLSICKTIIERHRGRMWVESEPEAGSRFYFTIPIKESNFDDRQPHRDPAGRR